ncbi:ATP-binding protein [Streptomyces sp. PAL114]|uniref:ATP-binding protein n=1 Tax=Streptomyces sp. PAL114 TaxID=2970893 RepID=UPI003966BE9E
MVQHLGEGVPVTVQVWCEDDGRVRLEVTDLDPRALPVLRAAGEDEESGRGLALLDAPAVRWGVTAGPGCGKTVWCELTLTTEERAAAVPYGRAPSTVR